MAIKLIMGLKVSEQEDMEELDLGEHGMEAYPDFSTSTGVTGTGYSTMSAATKNVGSKVLSESKASV